MSDFAKETLCLRPNDLSAFNFALYLTPPRSKPSLDAQSLHPEPEKVSLMNENEFASKNLLNDLDFLSSDLINKINDVSPAKSFVSSFSGFNNYKDEDQFLSEDFFPKPVLNVDQNLSLLKSSAVVYDLNLDRELNCFNPNFVNNNFKGGQVLLSINPKRNIFSEIKAKNLAQGNGFKEQQAFNYNSSCNKYNRTGINYEDKIDNNCKQSLMQDVLIKKKKKTFVERKGDWICMKCKNLNFSFRTMCNRCKYSKGESEAQYEEYLKKVNCSKGEIAFPRNFKQNKFESLQVDRPHIYQDEKDE